MNKKNYLLDLNNSKKPFIIYKSDKGFDLYTDFSKKIILNNKNIEKFINTKTRLKSTGKETDLFIGFFGYEILNNLINVKIKKQILDILPPEAFEGANIHIRIKSNRFFAARGQYPPFLFISYT